ncbi:hypothetical protein BDF20DRAFT_823004 [Mycotypha africana]|uniref:uncharacterized protein n=1 Tax=Mycotypha africana TaxID=64632 RepID=UPI002300B8F8|nr:uncharacterized protein BDF20DRAFT_823004 [Mycotypha africana]KAI8975552.1 hypothetical protein BDF20DRAFT_823004 [Mycotypha africana]
MIPFGRRRRSSRQHQPRQQRSTSFSSLSSTLFPSLSSSTTSSHISSDTQISSGTHEKEQHSHLSKLNKFIVSSITTSLSSLLSSNNKTAGTKPREICLDHLLEQYSIELKHLYLNAKAELDCAIETQGSVYYKDDRVTAGNALKSCNDKYFHVMDFLGDTTHAIKFKCRWERELEDLQSVFQDLPLSTPPVILEEEHEPSTAYQYFHKYN